MKKRYLLLTSVLALTGLLAACDGNNSGEGTKPQEYPAIPEEEVVPVENGATGAYSYVSSSYEERTKILGKLEAYAASNYLTGLPLFENGGYVRYNQRITKGTNTYIPGYGFGILSEGTINTPMAAEPTDAYKMYYHSSESSDPMNINAYDADGSQVSDLFSYIATSYWGTKMNATKDGYEWYGVLAKENRPVAVNPDASGMASKWRFHIRTGVDGLKYATNSANAERAAFNGRDVAAEDYLTIFKELLNQANGLYRGAELASQDDNSGIVGAAAYYKATAKKPGDEGYDAAAVAEAWDDVGVKLGEDDDGHYLEIELLAPATQFYAMYNLASSLYQPLPAEFITLVGGLDKYGCFNEDKTLSPVDNTLSLSPYVLESWTPDQSITFKRNANWFEFASEDQALANRYSIPGVHIAINKAAQSDPEAVYKEYLAGKVDAASIPTSYLEEDKGKPDTTTVPGSSVFKLNINSCTEEQWVEKFGENGSVAVTPKDEYWDVKPWMSNDDFLNGMLYAIDREEIATKYGVNPSCDYFGTAYMANPETGLSYNDTDEHKQALVDAGLEDQALLTDPNYERTYGYSLEAAKQSFTAAAEYLTKYGICKKGETLNVDIWWMYPSDLDEYGADVEVYLEDAFNNSDAKAVHGLKLDVRNEAGAVWSDVYYKHLMVGQFDLGFGSIAGNTLNPLNFMEVLKSNNSSGFTLNWGPDTAVASNDLVYDGKAWAFDSLWAAAEKGALVKNGVEVPPVVIRFGNEDHIYETNPDGSVTITFAFDLQNLAAILGPNAENLENCTITIDTLYLQDAATGAMLPVDVNLSSDDILNVISDGGVSLISNSLTVAINVPAVYVDYFFNEGAGGYVWAGFYYTLTINGSYVQSYCDDLILIVPGPVAEEPAPDTQPGEGEEATTEETTETPSTEEAAA